ncbi:hypothetical protein JXJ21_04690 [candidate division KSB1 bacterium]|nr:hypothetical protein [candidate division KSB1 bacterium]
MHEAGAIAGKIIASTGILMIVLAYAALGLKKWKETRFERARERERKIQTVYEKYRRQSN